MTDYTKLVTSEHQLPNFLATVALTANGIGDIVTLQGSLPALFDLDAAIGAQLDVVGQWVGVGRAVNAVLAVNFFGFADDVSALTFGEVGSPAVGGRFIEVGESASSTAILGDADFRLVIRAKIIANGYQGTAAQLEQAVADLTSVPCKFYDPGIRSVLIAPSADLDPVLLAELTQFDLLPRPAGVRYAIAQPQTLPYVWTTVANGAQSNQGQTVSKSGGAAAFDSSAYIQSPQQRLLLSWTVPDITHRYVGGLALNPSGSPLPSSQNYSFDLNFGTLNVLESGAFLQTLGTYAPGDSFTIYYDGNTAVFIWNGKIQLHITSGLPLALSPMFSFFSPGAVANSIALATG